jgi:apolipoprotein N-acyltransferase
MSFLLYLIGFIAFISGLAWVATLMGMAQIYVLGGALFLLGLAIVSAIFRARARAVEPPPA